jgi:hypothetical protein
MKEKVEFKIVYGNPEENETVSTDTLLTAQLYAHKRAVKKKTIVLTVKEIET